MIHSELLNRDNGHMELASPTKGIFASAYPFRQLTKKVQHMRAAPELNQNKQDSGSEFLLEA
jgi:hypothetical protein